MPTWRQTTEMNTPTESDDTAVAKGPGKGRIEPREGIDPVKPRFGWLWIALSAVVLGLVVMVLFVSEDTVDVAQTASPAPLQLVSVEEISVSRQRAEVRAFAEVRPRWSAQLSAAVSGRVARVFDSALAGEPVEAGTRLIEIENSLFVAELAAAKQALYEARLAQWQARNAATLARDDFERNRREPPNELALKLPQLEIAESAVIAAQARVVAAKKRLDDTMVVAPFAAHVVERFISPGQSVSPGDRLVKLVDRSAFELAVELGRDDWALLRRPIEGRTSQVLDQDGSVIAQATVRRAGGFLDESTRQYRVFLQIDNPAPGAVLSGDFVTVLLPSIVIDRALDVPASALTQEGYLWHLGDDDRLQRIEPRVLFRRGDRVVIEAPRGTEDWRVAVTPLVSFLQGQQVRPRRLEN